MCVLGTRGVQLSAGDCPATKSSRVKVQKIAKALNLSLQTLCCPQQHCHAVLKFRHRCDLMWVPIWFSLCYNWAVRALSHWMCFLLLYVSSFEFFSKPFKLFAQCCSEMELMIYNYFNYYMYFHLWTKLLHNSHKMEASMQQLLLTILL